MERKASCKSDLSHSKNEGILTYFDPSSGVPADKHPKQSRVGEK